MTTNKLISIFALVFTVSGLVPVAQASSRVDVNTNEKNYAESVSRWETRGEVDVLSDGRVEIAQDRREDGSVSTDVEVPSRNRGDYALVISFTRAEDPHADFGSGAENIAGLPYVYAYFMDEDDGILSYLQDDSARQHASDGTAWQVTYGIERMDDDVDSVRVFLKQASRAGVEADGRAAWFYKPAVYFLNDLSDANDVIDAYEDELDDVADAFHHRATNTNDDDEDEDDDEDTDYPVGTLLKCSGDSDVYSMTSDNELKWFPDEETFFAWGHSFADVRTISCSKLDDYDVSGRWTYTRANYLVKFRYLPAVFTLDNGTYLRLIPNEQTARAMYGRNWTSLVHEYSQSDMGDYRYSAPHRSR